MQESQDSSQQEELFFSVTQIHRLFGITPKTVQVWIKESKGRIPTRDDPVDSKHSVQVGAYAIFDEMKRRGVRVKPLPKFKPLEAQREEDQASQLTRHIEYLERLIARFEAALARLEAREKGEQTGEEYF